MCYDGEQPIFFDANYHTARKNHVCCECGLRIRRGERYETAVGRWPGMGNAVFRTCVVCEWFRDRLTAAEEQDGCVGSESVPPFGCLEESIDEAGRRIGLVNLLVYHEGQE